MLFCFLCRFFFAAAAVAVVLILPGVQANSPSIRGAWSSNSSETKGTWDDVKSCLCPKSIPQPSKFGSTLFKLARYEIGLNSAGRNEAEEEEFVQTFFRDPPKFSAYYRPPDGKISVIYIGNKKAASTQIKEHFLSIGLNRDANRDISSMNETQIAPDACVITAVRDPIERFLSGYSELEHRTVTKATYKGRVDKLPVRYKTHRIGETRRFEQLVEDFLSDPGFLSARGEGQDYADLLRHMWGQTRILTRLDDMGKRLTSYLPTISKITEEWESFVVDNCPSAAEYIGSQPAPMEVTGQHHSSKDVFNFREAANSAWAERGPTARALCALHAMDYACLDRLPDGVHELCAEVYSSRHFLDEIEKGCE